MTANTQTTGRQRQRPAAKPTPQPPIEAAAATEPSPRGKIGLVVELLRRPDGATIPDMMAATGWQAHSVRGAIAGAIKKKLGLPVISTKSEAGRIYRIEAGDDAA